MDHVAKSRILIFLPKAVATLIAARLNDIGYVTSIACSVPDLDAQGASPDFGTKQFDSKAFLGRVKALTEPGRAREKPVAGINAATATGRIRWFWRLFQMSPAGAPLSS
ncbi:hypothetical protein HFN63_36420 [Rhizobium leguminosarum]|uniref:hypothetical protein n=1 Tax=Rhizobium leguminosarum TaxID=384 RepID=UPI001C946A1B|nr:hypothetical protein [Rhizobium leguminosarum]MBY5775414.1 hypothetical protein [Rhizobium leguminosarum]